MIHTAALYIPRKVDQDDTILEQIICVCGEIFVRDKRREPWLGESFVEAPAIFAEHLKEMNCGS